MTTIMIDHDIFERVSSGVLRHKKYPNVFLFHSESMDVSQMYFFFNKAPLQNIRSLVAYFADINEYQRTLTMIDFLYDRV